MQPSVENLKNYSKIPLIAGSFFWSFIFLLTCINFSLVHAGGCCSKAPKQRAVTIFFSHQVTLEEFLNISTAQQTPTEPLTPSSHSTDNFFDTSDTAIVKKRQNYSPNGSLVTHWSKDTNDSSSTHSDRDPRTQRLFKKAIVQFEKTHSAIQEAKEKAD